MYTVRLNGENQKWTSDELEYQLKVIVNVHKKPKYESMSFIESIYEFVVSLFNDLLFWWHYGDDKTANQLLNQFNHQSFPSNSKLSKLYQQSQQYVPTSSPSIGLGVVPPPLKNQTPAFTATTDPVMPGQSRPNPGHGAPSYSTNTNSVVPGQSSYRQPTPGPVSQHTPFWNAGFENWGTNSGFENWGTNSGFDAFGPPPSNQVSFSFPQSQPQPNPFSYNAIPQPAPYSVARPLQPAQQPYQPNYQPSSQPQGSTKMGANMGGSFGYVKDIPVNNGNEFSIRPEGQNGRAVTMQPAQPQYQPNYQPSPQPQVSTKMGANMGGSFGNVKDITVNNGNESSKRPEGQGGRAVTMQPAQQPYQPNYQPSSQPQGSTKMGANMGGSFGKVKNIPVNNGNETSIRPEGQGGRAVTMQPEQQPYQPNHQPSSQPQGSTKMGANMGGSFGKVKNIPVNNGNQTESRGNELSGRGAGARPLFVNRKG
jgi:hypothetical protein